MKLKELKKLIKEELDNIQKEYSVEDLLTKINNGQSINISIDGGYSSSKYTNFEHFKSRVLNNPFYKGKTFISNYPNSYILKDTEAPDLSSYYDDTRFTGD